jgi:SnoaL-like domain
MKIPEQGDYSNPRYLADRVEIDDLLTRYTVAIDTKQFDLLGTVFLPDARIDYTAAGGIAGAYPEVKAWLSEVLQAYAMTQHLVVNRQVEIAGDRATARSCVYNPMGSSDGKGGLKLFFMGGYYEDQLVRTASGWRIAERTEKLAWVDRPAR